MSKCKFKVHSAIYSCDASSSTTIAGYDVTQRVQGLLRDNNKEGVLKIDSKIIENSNTYSKKCFAILVTVVYPDGKILTRFSSCSEGSTIDLKMSGVVCSF
ncbi:hypothetical protein [Winogradskyella haliclonae]|uniref:TonB C-terminal domain-containing protein n=1 Tax=Winogradskyella haliclonae TaxID=2048558 RepID=A0ABQ2BW92_9FLAO|nr:hypothetical protein [Winogradskyella haliclonae]GGI56732.1 hypothetical protein GCM10011444_10410 [Winogradskyella haliclonae]